MPDEPASTRRDVTLGIGVTLAALAVVELASRGPIHVDPIVTVTLLIGSLAAVAYAAFVAGLMVGLIAGAMVGVYTAYWSWSSNPSSDPLQALLIMTVIAETIAVVVGLLKRRADRAAQETLRIERAHTEAMRRANAQLEAANEALEAFTYLVSHDLKEPVRSTDMLLAFLEEDHASKLDPDARELLARARRANHRLADLLASLLELSHASRLDARAVAPVDVGAALRGELGMIRFESLAKERGAVVQIDIEGAPRVLATTDAIEQIFGNLVSNAIKHNANATPHVVVRAEPPRGDLVAFTIEDDGPGFSATQIARFQDAEALPSSTKDGGFGLIIARRAIARLHGRMTLGRSKDLGGALVRVELPISRT